jgi:hypothetical protein
MFKHLGLRSLVCTVFLLASTAVASAQCSLQLSDHGVLRLQSGEQRHVTWNTVPGATSYFVEDVRQSLGDPASPDFAFGAPYSEAHDGESPNLTSYLIGHTVLYKTTFRLRVTALNRGNASFQPCSDEVTYVVDADADLASIAARRILPLAGKANAANGGAYSTALIVAGTGLGCTHQQPCNPAPTDKLYQGQIVFRPLGQPASDTDPSMPYAINGDETLTFDDVMSTLGATGLGTIEVIPKPGYPTPQADALVDSRLPNGQHSTVRIGSAWGRDYLNSFGTVTAGIRNADDTRLAIGVRTYSLITRLAIDRLAASGETIDSQQVYANGGTTTLYPVQSLFPGIQAGDRLVIHFSGLNFDSGLVQPGGAVVVFLTETSNGLNVPNLFYRETIDSNHYSQGFDYYVVR